MPGNPVTIPTSGENPMRQSAMLIRGEHGAISTAPNDTLNTDPGEGVGSDKLRELRASSFEVPREEGGF